MKSVAERSSPDVGIGSPTGACPSQVTDSNLPMIGLQEKGRLGHRQSGNACTGSLGLMPVTTLAAEAGAAQAGRALIQRLI